MSRVMVAKQVHPQLYRLRLLNWLFYVASIEAGAAATPHTHSPSPSHLHLVYVGRVVSAAAQLGGGLAAAVWHHSAVALPGADPDALGPVGGAVAAAALELKGEEHEK